MKAKISEKRLAAWKRKLERVGRLIAKDKIPQACRVIDRLILRADGIFPPEFVVGRCVRVAAETGEPFQKAEVLLLFSPGRLESVTVIDAGPLRAEEESLPD